MKFLLAASKILVLLLPVVSIVDCQCSGSTVLSLSASDTTVGTFTSKNYPSRYENNLKCTTDVSASGTKQVLFYLEYESIEPRYDHLHIYTDLTDPDKKIHDSDRHDAPRFLVSTGNTLIADFETDSSLTVGGYKINYVAIDLVNQGSCGSIINATTSYQQLARIDSSSQPSTCTWTIVPEDNSGSFTIEINILLISGVLVIDDGGSTSTYVIPDQVYVSPSNPAELTVSGQSDTSFVIKYRQVAYSVTGISITTTPAVDTSICGSTSVTSDTQKQYLTSPNYPGLYANNLNCKVTIEANDTSQSVLLNITDYDVAINDYIQVYDGPTTQYNLLSSSIQTGMTFNSSGSSLTVIFYTNDFAQQRGFEFSYNSVNRATPQCSDTFSLNATVTSSGTEQTIESPNYPNLYYHNDDMYWLIVKPNESVNVVLDFRVFSVEYADNCMYDYVNVYDGACTTDPLLIKVCGDDPITIEEPTGIYILVHFHTDFSVNKNGWQLTHYIGSFVDPETENSEESSKDGLPDYVYPSIAIAIIIIIGIPAAIIFYNTTRKRVGIGDGKEPIKKRTTRDVLKEINNNSNKQEVKQPKIRRKEGKYHLKPNPPGPNATIINVNEQNPHPPPGHTDTNDVPPFLRTSEKIPEKNVAPASTSSNGAPPEQNIPPFLNGTGTQMTTQNVAPASTGTDDQLVGQKIPPSGNGTATEVSKQSISPGTEQAPKLVPYVSDMSIYTGPGIPPAFPYKTPAEARKLGMYV